MIKVVVNLGTALTVPARVTAAEQRCLRLTAEQVVRAVGDASRSKQIAAATHVQSTSLETATIVVGDGVPFARIRDRGGTIVPRSASILRFATGEFRPRARQRGIRYLARAEQELVGAAGEAFQVSFGAL